MLNLKGFWEVRYHFNVKKELEKWYLLAWLAAGFYHALS